MQECCGQATWGVAQLQRWLHESVHLCREVSFFVCTSLLTFLGYYMGLTCLKEDKIINADHGSSRRQILGKRGRWLLLKLVSVYIFDVYRDKRYCEIEY